MLFLYMIILVNVMFGLKNLLKVEVKVVVMIVFGWVGFFGYVDVFFYVLFGGE